MLGHFILSMWNINSGSHVLASILGIRASNFKTLCVDASSEAVPERVLDHSRETVHGILGKTSFIQDNALASIVSGKCEFLKKIR